MVPREFRGGEPRHERDEREGQSEDGSEVLVHSWFLLSPIERLPVYAPNSGPKCHLIRKVRVVAPVVRVAPHPHCRLWHR